MNIQRHLTALSAVPLAIAVLALSACGSDNSNSSTTAASTAGGGSAQTVSATTVGGTSDVLVDSSGQALYSPSQEANGMIKCTGSCEQIWMPLTVNGTPTASDVVSGKLGTVKRPDGSEQVTLDGAPLYTFAEDSPGQTTGDGVQDSFDGNDFTWHVITVGGTAAGGSTPPTTTSSSSGGSGYSY